MEEVRRWSKPNRCRRSRGSGAGFMSLRGAGGRRGAATTATRWIYGGATSTAHCIERKLGDFQIKKLLHMTWSELICNGQLMFITIVQLIGNDR